MKHFLIISYLLALCMISCQYKSNKQPSSQSLLPKGSHMMGTTPIKNQGRSELCWLYGMLSTIESEHIMRGDSVNLSSAYIVRMMLCEKATDYYLAQGKGSINMRGTMPLLLYYMGKYGMVPYDSYEDPKDIDYKVLCRKVELVCRGAIAQQTGIAELQSRVNQLLDQEMGYLPAKTVYMLGAEYTPSEFANSVCYPDEYAVFTSFTHHPFGKPMVLEVPDNQHQDTFYNIPLRQMMSIIDRAIRNGHPVCWEGDISEPSFMHPEQGYVDVAPQEKPVTQASRQRAFERLQTTDDHVMSIVGTCTHQGQLYYICRNSWGKEWGMGGYICLSKDYLRLKTIALAVSKEALK